MDSEKRKAIGKSLQGARKAAGFKSARAFAEHMGIPASAYTEYEQGRNGFSYEQAWEFADALGCTLDEVGGREFPGESLSADEETLVSTFRSVTVHGKKAMLTNAKAVGEDYLPKSDNPDLAAPLTTKAAS